MNKATPNESKYDMPHNRKLINNKLKFFVFSVKCFLLYFSGKYMATVTIVSFHLRACKYYSVFINSKYTI